MNEHDLIVIGGGAAGLGALRAARWAGRRAALVTDGPPGGDCTFTGCVPSKTLLASGRQGLSFSSAMARVAETVATIAATESVEVLRAEGVDVIEGRARFTAPGRIDVDGKTFEAPNVVIATGAAPLVPGIPGLAQVHPLTTDELFTLAETPRSVAVIGAGPVGVEMGQALASLGVTTAVFEASPRVLPGEEPDASAAVAAALEAEGAVLHTGVAVDRVEGAGPGVAVVAGDRRVEADRILVAAGRRPVTTGLGLEELGVELDGAGHVVVDDRMRTSVDGIYAAGDVTGRSPYTHAADEMGRIAAMYALGTRMRWRFRADVIPHCVFTDPELARVGVTEAEAAAIRGARVAELPMSEYDRAIIDGRTEGYIKLIAAPHRVLRGVGGGRLIGATVVGPRAGELIAEAALAMRTTMLVGRLAQTVHAYPTWAAAVPRTAAQFIGEIDGRRARPARPD